MKKRLLHIALKCVGEPNHCMTDAFINAGFDVKELDWIQLEAELGTPAMNRRLIEEVHLFNPHIIFMQLQRHGAINVQTAIELSKHSYVVNWTGDVREDISWYEELAPHIFVTLFTNETDVEKMRAKGLRADYLQVGFDTNIFKPEHKTTQPDIVFLGNNYIDSMKFPLSAERASMVEVLQKEFGEQFKVYGHHWSDTRHLNTSEENDCYRRCKIAINQNHFDYKKFSSDRILRIMGSGAFCLTKYFEGIEDEYENKKHLVWWKDFDDLISKCKYYLLHEKERIKIAKAGCEHVHANCSWEARFGNEFSKIINKNQHGWKL